MRYKIRYLNIIHASKCYIIIVAIALTTIYYSDKMLGNVVMLDNPSHKTSFLSSNVGAQGIGPNSKTRSKGEDFLCEEIPTPTWNLSISPLNSKKLHNYQNFITQRQSASNSFSQMYRGRWKYKDRALFVYIVPQVNRCKYQ